MSDAQPEGADPVAAPGPLRQAVLFADMVESTMVIAGPKGPEVIARWRALVATLRAEWLPPHSGRLIRHVGDGVLLLFETVADALRVAQLLIGRLQRENALEDAEGRIRLRVGIHLCEVVIDEIDIYGAGVNVAARLAAQAEPDQILLTVEANEQLHPSLDAATQDLGEFFFKHVANPVRVYAVCGETPDRPSALTAPPADVLRPALAILPFRAEGVAAEGIDVGELVADELICALSSLHDVRLVSRLSTSLAARRVLGPETLASSLHADYVVSGTCRLIGDRLVVHAQLQDGHRGELLRTMRHTASMESLLAEDSPIVSALLEDIGGAILNRQLELARRCALPNLAGYTLLLGGITLMHRLALRDVQRSLEMLEHLAQRWPRLAAPHAWMGRWHLFSYLQGWSRDPAKARQQALESSQRALDLDPRSSVALAVGGSVRTHLDRDVEAGITLYEDALRVNPSDSFAWMLLGTAHAFKGQGYEAVGASANAARLSPLDPMHFLYDCHGAAAALAADEFGRALELAERSMRANAQHLSTYRVLAIAQMLNNQGDSARQTISRLLKLDPRASVQGYLRNNPSAGYEIGRRFAKLLGEAGLPSHVG